MDTFEFINKVFIAKKKRSIKRAIARIGFIICLLAIIVLIKLNKGINSSITSFIFLMAVFGSMSIRKGNPNGFYKEVPCSILFDDGLTIINRELDRNDSLGQRNEITTFKNGDIEKIYYNRKINSMKIVGNGIMTTKWITRKNRKDHVQKVKETYLWPNEENWYSVVDTIQKGTNMNVEYVNSQ
jgi:hypothetical protein